MELTAIHTRHSIKRCQQRGITSQMIDDTIHFGEMIQKQGLRFYIMTEKCLSYFCHKQYNDRIKNTVIVLTSDDAILTVYKNSRALKSIKKKSKNLYK